MDNVTNAPLLSFCVIGAL